MTLHARHGSHGPSELTRLQYENERLRAALMQCREYVWTTTGSWWNNHEARDLMTKHIHPALGLDPWHSGV